MNRQELLDRVSDLNVWRRGDERAPHKPLLLLYALGRFARDGGRPVPYRDVDAVLGELLADYGPPRKSVHPEYPFWRLQRDGLWEVAADGPLEPRRGHTDAKKSELVAKDARGSFPPEVAELLQRDGDVLRLAARLLLDGHFPASLHEDLLEDVGLDLEVAARRRPRDPEFRTRVLRAYEYRCAVCGFDVRLDDATVGLEAAHIKWHQAGGPDIEPNGLALCTLHHKLFDRGAFTIFESGVLRISERLQGGASARDWLFSFHGRAMRPPLRTEYEPGREFVEWHRSEVFREPARP